MKGMEKTSNIGRKFNEDGSIRFFPGNTIISKVLESNEIYPIITHISKEFQMADKGESYHFLPWDSLHMTMIQGVCDEDRRPSLWSRYLPLDMKLSQVDDFFETKYKEVKQLPETRMVFDYIDLSKKAILVRFVPKDEQSAENLKNFRDEVSDKLGVRFPDHDNYGFHISIAYQLWEMTQKEKENIQKVCETLSQEMKHNKVSFTLQQPEMTYFYNMYTFHSTRILRED